MRRAILLVGLLLASCGAASATVYLKWNVGQEREVSAGNYAKLLYQQSGWRVWKFETKDGVRCKAAKSADGKALSYPLGVSDYLYQGTPRLEVYLENGAIKGSRLWGQHTGGKAEFRGRGDRFWRDWEGDTDLSSIEGQQLEVHTDSYEYPAIFEGRANEFGVINLVGLMAAVAASRGCA